MRAWAWGVISRSSQLRDASVAQWALQMSGLPELRDQREAATLSQTMDHINRDELAQAMDLLAQRVLAIQAAKRKGGSWEKAEALELLPPAGAALAAGAMASLAG